MSDDNNISETRAQLDMIENALKQDPTNSDLLQLQCELKQLLSLLSPEADAIESGSVENKDERVSPSTPVEDLTSKLEGQKVRAPVRDRGDCSELGNAVILGLEAGQEDRDHDEVRVRLVFSHPTSERLVACKYYLDGRCSRPAEDCRWSHGEVRRLGDLASYQEPDWSLLVRGCRVLARNEKGVWTRGQVTEVTEIMGEAEYLVTWDTGGGEPSVKTVEEIWPLETQGDTEEEDQEPGGDPGLESFVPTEIGNSGVKFGDWESHTRGLGSRLLLKMGWVVGNGLGQRGEGRVEPVTARLYPQGKGLDWCMDMREKYGDSLGQDVEKIMKKEAKEAAKRSKQRAEAESKRDNSAKSLFDFINVNLSTGQASSSGIIKKPEKDKCKTLIKDESDEKIKLRKFKMSEQAGRLEKEISKLQESYSRHKGKDTTLASSISSNIQHKTAELNRINAAAKNLSKEEGSRKSKSN